MKVSLNIDYANSEMNKMGGIGNLYDRNKLIKFCRKQNPKQSKKDCERAIDLFIAEENTRVPDVDKAIDDVFGKIRYEK